ncbi:MAG: hypothetical protein ACXW1Z_19995 [Methylobacter sp.]
MKSTSFKTALVAVSILFSAGYADVVLAHSGGAVTDAAGNNAGATDLVAVTCSDDGNGTPHHLTSQIKDQSGPVSGLLLSLHLQKGNQMKTATDSVSGDANYSPEISLNGGPGVYYMSITKTAAGARLFDIIWHCMTSDGQHTGTDIAVLQYDG